MEGGIDIKDLVVGGAGRIEALAYLERIGTIGIIHWRAIANTHVQRSRVIGHGQDIGQIRYWPTSWLGTNKSVHSSGKSEKKANATKIIHGQAKINIG